MKRNKNLGEVFKGNFYDCVYMSQNLTLQQKLWNINNLQPNNKGNISSEIHNYPEPMNPNIITSKVIHKKNFKRKLTYL